jgi:NAD(P)-dependent dehydrogenase (short-subunit alcohol dehydrogenase family)
VDESGLAETEGEIRELGRSVLTRRVDVSSAQEMRAFAETVHREVEAVDLLMNNAGVGLGARFLDTLLEDWEWVVRINLFGVIHGCHFFVPPMVQRGRGGHVVNVSSAAGYAAGSVMTAYSTSKFGVLGLSEALREELAPFGIGVTAVCPGIINTSITQNSRLRGAVADPEQRRRFIELYRRRDYGPERVARNVLKAVQRNRAVAPISPEAWAFYALKRISPTLMGRVRHRLTARNFDEPR